VRRRSILCDLHFEGAIAAGLGLVVSKAVLAPVQRLMTSTWI